jgi:outer membrane protein OmpA-like peptidoglycan-associated protein
MKIRTGIIFLLSLVIFACAKRNIEVSEFYNNNEINEGDSAKLAWSFKNADFVKITGSDIKYLPVDCLFVKPSLSQSYSITAYSGLYDSLVKRVFVEVLPSVKDTIIKRGPITLTEKPHLPSLIETDYFSGFINIKEINPHILKIMKTFYERSSNYYTANFIVLDRFGNFIENLKDIAGDLNIQVKNSCESQSLTYIINSFSDNKEKYGNVDFGILIDNSASANDNISIYGKIKDFINEFSPEDNVMISYFNHNYHPLFSLVSPEKLLWDINDMELPENKGLNGIHKAVYRSIENLRKGNNRQKALVVITTQTDNSSIIYQANDCAGLAKKYNIPVYIIGLGDSFSSYSLRYITMISGGRYYPLNEEGDYDKLDKILKEILLAQKSNYTLKIPVARQDLDCRKLNSSLKINFKGKEYEDKISIIIKPDIHVYENQILCSFQKDDYKINDEYTETISDLAQILMSDPARKISLTGHSSPNEQSPDYNLSEKRVIEVKNILLQIGVPENQVEVNYSDDSKPNFYLELEPWQADYNRRVEIKWLDPSSLPYEIIADTYPAEQPAIKSADEWEKKGYRAYFDRINLNKEPLYRIKLWVFSIKDEANKAIKELTKDNKIKFSVE